MNEVLMTKVNAINQLLDKKDYTKVVEGLKNLAQEYPEEGVIPYYLGRLCVGVKEEILAYKYFEKAIEMGYENADLYFSMALIEKKIAPFNDTEKTFLKALDLVESQEEKWTVLSSLAVFYIEEERYLKADKYAKKMIKEFPHNYQGYHLHIIIEAVREHYEELESYMEKIPEEFKKHPQYLIDLIEVYKKQGKDEELFEKMDNEPRFIEMIPQIVLKEKVKSMPNDEEDDSKEELIRKLANEYHDKEAIVSLMVLEFSRKNFKKSAEIATIVLENEKQNQGVYFYLATYFQIFNLYYMADKKPSKELVKWIEKAGNWCIDFTENLDNQAISGPVRQSIEELFDEINAANSK